MVSSTRFSRYFLAPLLVLFAALFTIAAQAAPLDAQIAAHKDNGQLPGLHGVIIDLGDERVAETYFPGEDERWGASLGMVSHNGETLHDLRSITKSIVGLLYGIALEEGIVPPVDTPLYDQFPEYPDLQKEARRSDILISHALTMRMGLQWNEAVPYTDPRNSEIAMENASDRYRYILEQPIISPAGETWTYSGGAAALIGKLISQGANMPLDAYAHEKLFKPLGISQFEWVAGRDGIPSAASGLRLTLPDLAKIGALIAADGQYQGQQIVAKEWLTQSFTPRVKVSNFSNYGYFWYLSGAGDKTVIISVGNGGQRLHIQPGIDLVMAAFVGLYNEPSSWETSFKILTQIAVPWVKKKLGRE